MAVRGQTIIRNTDYYDRGLLPFYSAPLGKCHECFRPHSSSSLFTLILSLDAKQSDVSSCQWQTRFKSDRFDCVEVTDLTTEKICSLFCCATSRHLLTI